MKITFRCTAVQHSRLKAHLLKGDGFESLSIALCGVRRSGGHVVLMLHEVWNISDAECSLRSHNCVRWPTEAAIPIFDAAIRRGMAFLKIHSHPAGFGDFSQTDDHSDAVLCQAMQSMADEPILFASAFMLPDGRLRLRIWGLDSKPRSCDRITLVGDSVQFTDVSLNKRDPLEDEATLRTRQAFGDATTVLLSRLTVGVVGCSGTGSWVVEMVGRLGVKKLVLVDPDAIERKNLNRIVNSTATDAEVRQSKVVALSTAVAAMGMGTEVAPYQTDLDNRDAVLALAECDFLFGCVDSADGRDALNRLATYYLIPFIDIGVRLDADADGGIRQITVAIHYLLPGGSTLLSRGVITAKQVSDHSLWRTDRQRYEGLKAEGYVHGVAVDSPAVVSINGFAASHAVNEMLARVHPFRRDGNEEFRHQVFSLTDGIWHRIPDDREASEYLARKVGRGDCRPLLDNPAIE